MWCQIISSSSQTAISPCDDYLPVTILCPCPEVVIISDILCSRKAVGWLLSGLKLFHLFGKAQGKFSCYPTHNLIKKPSIPSMYTRLYNATAGSYTHSRVAATARRRITLSFLLPWLPSNIRRFSPLVLTTFNLAFLFLTHLLVTRGPRQDARSGKWKCSLFTSSIL